MKRTLVILAAVVLAAVVVWHPAPRPVPPTVGLGRPVAQLPPGAHRRRGGRPAGLGGGAPAGGDAVVYVVGAVRRPGLYRMPPGARVSAAVAAAGGFTALADPAGINLAARVADGEELDAPRVGQSARPAARRTGRRVASASPAAQSVDVNTADAGSLAHVPGFGRVIAQRIVALREREGAYESLDELLDVAGVSAAKLARARPFLQAP